MQSLKQGRKTPANCAIVSMNLDANCCYPLSSNRKSVVIQETEPQQAAPLSFKELRGPAAALLTTLVWMIGWPLLFLAFA